MYSKMPFDALFSLQGQMIKARVPLCVDNLQLMKGSALNKELLMLDGRKVYTLTDAMFQVKQVEGVYIVTNSLTS